MLNSEQIEALKRAIDERIVRLERRVEKLQAEIGDLESSKDELTTTVSFRSSGGGGGGGTMLPPPPPPQSKSVPTKEI